MTSPPPRLAERLLSWTIPGADRDAIVGDLAEEYQRRVARSGVRTARRWYWRETLRCVAPSIWGRLSPTRGTWSPGGPRGGDRFAWVGDVRAAVRGLGHAPGFSLTVLSCLTLGSILSVVMFGVVNALLAGDLPGVRERRQLARVVGETAGRLQELTVADAEALAERALPGVEGLASQWASRGFAVQINGQAVTAAGQYVNGAYLQTLGTDPYAGRTLHPADDRSDAAAVVMLSHRFAQRQFGEASEAVGQTIRIGTGLFVVVGVLPPRFPGLRAPSLGKDAEDRGDLWVPMRRLGAQDANLVQAGACCLSTVVRLADDVGLPEAEASLVPLAHSMNAQRTGGRELDALKLEPFHLFEANHSAAERTAQSAGLMAVPMLILLVACANVAAVAIARAMARTHELAIRVSLGATRFQVMRLLVLEIGILAALAGLIAWALSVQLLHWAGGLLPFAVGADRRVFLFSVFVPVAAAVMAALLPAWRATGFDVLEGLRLGLRMGGHPRRRLSTLVLGSQIALSIALLSGAAHLLRAFSVDVVPPESFKNVLVANVRLLNPAVHSETAHLARQRIVDEAGRISGVEVAAIGSRLLAQENGRADRRVSADWFRAIGLPFLAGRVFPAGEEGVVVINKTWARDLGGIDQALGKEIGLMGKRRAVVIGVVENGFERAAWGHDVPVAYSPIDHEVRGEFTLYLRGSAATAAESAIRAILASVDPTLAPSQVGTVEALLTAHRRGDFHAARALAIMSTIALVLAAVGLFGATAQSAARRKREFGIRLALGANPLSLGFTVLRQAFAVTFAGGLVGIGSALGLLRALAPPTSDQLTGLDPIPLLLSVTVLVGLGAAASLLPVLRVMAIDPAVSLRAE